MKILFVCTGNICRSAMAQAILEKKLQQKEKSKKIEVYSAGIYAQNGESATYYAQQVMQEMQIDLKQHRATNISCSKIEEMDLILAMTTMQKIELQHQYPQKKDRIYTAKEYVGEDREQWDIRDPWGYDIEVYRFCASEIEEVVNKLLEKID